MKKSLSLLVAIAMVFSMFAAVASAATASEAGAKLQQLGVIQGDQNGNLMEDATWKRQDLAVLLSRLLGVEEEAAAADKTHTYADVPAGFYDGYLSWAKEEAYMEGHSATKFGFSETLSNQQFYAVVLRALGIDTTGDNYAKTMELAVEVGIVAEGTDPAADAKRGATYVAVVAALDTVVEGTNETLGEKLGLVVNEKATGIASASATGAREFTVNFNGAIDTEKAKLEVKRNNVTVTGTKTAFADDKKSATVTLETKIVEADYSIVLSGIDGLDSAKATAAVKGENEKLTKIEFLTTGDFLPKANNVKIEFAATNQYGDKTDMNASNFRILDNGFGHSTVSGEQAFKMNLASKAKDDKIPLTIIHEDSNIQANKIFTVGEAPIVSAIEVGDLKNADNETITSIEQGKKAYLEYKAYDQYGITFDSLSATEGLNAAKGVTVVIPDPNLKSNGFISSVIGDDRPDLELEATSNANAKTVNVTLYANGSGKNVSKAIEISTPKVPASIEFGNYDKMLAEGDDNDLDDKSYFYVPIIVKNAKGEKFTQQEIVDNVDKFTVYPMGGALNLETVGTTNHIVLSGEHKGKIAIDSTAGKGSSSIVIQLREKPEVKAQISISVGDKRKADRITITDDPNAKLQQGASDELKVKFYDQYGEEFKATGYVADVKLEKVGNADTDAITALIDDSITLDSSSNTLSNAALTSVFDKKIKLTAANNLKGSYKLTVTLKKEALTLPVTAADVEIHSVSKTVEAITGLNDSGNNSLTYTVSLDKGVEGNVIYGYGDNTLSVSGATYGTKAPVYFTAADLTGLKFAKEVKVSGKDTNGATVALPDKVTAVQSTDSTIVATDVRGQKGYIAGLKAGSAKVTVWFNTPTGEANATFDVVVKEDLPSATKITAAKSANNINSADLLVANGGISVWHEDMMEKITVVDQYGSEYVNEKASKFEIQAYNDVLKVRYTVSNVRKSGADAGVFQISNTGVVTYTGDASKIQSFTINAQGANGVTASTEITVD